MIGKMAKLGSNHWKTGGDGNERRREAARFLVENGVPIDKLNLGNMHFSEGKHVSKEPHVYLDEKDEEDIETIKARGIRVFIQIAPGDTQYDM